jgi:hypothetical protein
MRNVALDLGAKKIAYCEVSSGKGHRASDGQLAVVTCARLDRKPASPHPHAATLSAGSCSQREESKRRAAG